MINATLDKMMENEKTAEYTRGEYTLLRAYYNSRDDYEELVINDSGWDDEQDDIIALLRKAGIKTFVMADHSTALLRTLYKFLEAGFKITGAVTLERINRTRWEKPLKGLTIEVD